MVVVVVQGGKGRAGERGARGVLKGRRRAAEVVWWEADPECWDVVGQVDLKPLSETWKP